MATLWISEYESIGNAGGGIAQLAKEPSVTSQTITYTTSTAATTAFNDKTKFIRVIASADAYLAFGPAPTATATSLYLPSGTAEYFAVNSGEKVAAYDGTS